MSLNEWSTSGTSGTFRTNQLDRERLNIERHRAALQMQRERRRRQPGYPVAQRANRTDPGANASTRHRRTRAPSTDT